MLPSASRNKVKDTAKIFILNIIRFLVLCGGMLLMNECHTYFFKTNRRTNILFLFYVCGPAAMCNVIRIGVYVQSGTPIVSYLAPLSAGFLASLATIVNRLLRHYIIMLHIDPA